MTEKNSKTTLELIRTVSPKQKKWTLGLTWGVIAALVVLGLFSKLLPMGILVTCYAFLMALFLGIHASTLIGPKAAAKMFILGILLAYAFEETCIHLNVGGGYTFLKMGPKIDVVPPTIPFGWVCTIYITWVMINFILDGAPTPRNNSQIRLWARALAAALVLTTIDLGGDPLSVSNGYWVWHQGGPYFGVPVANYTIIWLGLGFLALLIHGYMERKHVDLTLDHATRGFKIWTILPILLFGFFTVALTGANFKGIFGINQLFAMGGPFMLALIRWFDWYKTVK
ncbi:carotenoid biosynthesis protein [Ligilactobacillus acidipiscis]|uniref:carotenoid biosynthesis protein n=1 Tax=Ligilactobacillus acidipiscis TaxID=89059 RepID=UPI0023F85A42|nr:carotenoid biosynthesis protein [Ligilactobacillus acidipiscis]WEV57147.1 carotenoid biosynthesis protein [Ligilactobacillus acidipiscis]